MDDLISRQMAVDALGEKPFVLDDLSDFELGKATQWADDVEAIKNLPSAQRTGRWEPVSMQTSNEVVYRCSVCDKLLWFATDYCPHCGAKMESE